MQLKYLITGAAGFIGFHLSAFLSKKGMAVIGIDNVNDYYDVNLKNKRLELLSAYPNFRFIKEDICNKEGLDELFRIEKFDVVINLAAQAGVRYSIEQPYKYIDSNLIGFVNIVEACRSFPVKHLIFASSSSVYGDSQETPFKTEQSTDHPVSLYAATKKANELMAHAYAHLYDIQATGLRFFTVYGPWGRPDMAYFSFTKKIMRDEPIALFNHGKMRRDFTYIDDVVDGIWKLIEYLDKRSFKWEANKTPLRVFNIGNHQPVELADFIKVLENCIEKKAIIELKPMQDGDVLETFADIEPLQKLTGFYPSTDIHTGLSRFIKWYKEYYQPANIPAL